MKHIIRALTLTLLFLCISAFATEPLMLGILEEPQCRKDAPRAARPLFVKKNAEWLALNSKEVAAGFKLDRIVWTAAFDGKNIGQFISTDPKRNISPEWTYPRDYLQVLESGQTLPEIKNKSKAFSGWCETPQHFPIVLVSDPNFEDPEQWKPDAPSHADREKLLLAFREATKQAPLCQVSENEKRRPYKYGSDDFRIVAVFKNARDRQLVSVTLKKEYSPCNALSWSEPPKWFLVDKTAHYLGNNLSLIDAGDYDKDGKSEVIFWYSSYNRDGYVLFSDDFKKRVDFIWGYH
jgi:hypothetical protein